MMKRFIIWVSIIFIIQGQTQKPITVLTSQRIEQSGISRLSDLFFLLDDWDFYTPDAFRISALPRGSGTYHSEKFKIMINGSLYNPDFMDEIKINHLPITLNMIDSIEVYTLPQIIEGVYVESALLHIHTKTPDKGFSARLKYASINESGDPGPYSYTPYTSANVDETGPDYEILSGWRGKSLFLQGGYHYQKHLSTDPVFIDRHSDAERKYLRTQLISPFLTGFFENDKLSIRFMGGYTTSDKLNPFPEFGSDLLFNHSLGEEIPVSSEYSVINFSGDIYFNKSKSRTKNNLLKYGLNIEKNILKKPSMNFPVNFDWNLLKHTTWLSWQNNNFNNMEVGWRYNSGQLKSKNLSGNNKNINHTIYFKQNYNLYKKAEQSFHTQLNYQNNKFGFKGTIVNNFKFKKHCFNLLLNYTLKSFGEDNSLWYWINNGYRLPEQLELEYQLPQKIKSSRIVSTNFNWEYKLFDFIQSQYSLKGQFYDDFLLPGKINDHSMVLNQVTGKVISNSLKFTFKLPKILTHRFYISYQNTFNSNADFIEKKEAHSPIKITYQATLIPAPDFSLWSKFTYLSGTYWTDYSETPYPSKLSEYYLLDFSIQKWFWKRKIRSAINFKNVLNQDFQMNPMGAPLNFTLVFQMEWLIN